MAPGVISFSPLLLLLVVGVLGKPWYTLLNDKMSSIEGFSRGLETSLVPSLTSFASSVKRYRSERDKPPTLPKSWEEQIDEMIKTKDVFSGKEKPKGDMAKVFGKLTGKGFDEADFGDNGKKRPKNGPWWTSDVTIFLFLFLTLGLVSASVALLLVRTRTQTSEKGPKVKRKRKATKRRKS